MERNNYGKKKIAQGENVSTIYIPVSLAFCDQRINKRINGISVSDSIKGNLLERERAQSQGSKASLGSYDG